MTSPVTNERLAMVSSRQGDSLEGDKCTPENTGHSPNALSMLGQRLRRWPNIETALGECPVFAGTAGLC